MLRSFIVPFTVRAAWGVSLCYCTVYFPRRLRCYTLLLYRLLPAPVGVLHFVIVLFTARAMWGVSLSYPAKAT